MACGRLWGTQRKVTSTLLRKETNNNLWALGLAGLRHQPARGGGDGVQRALKAKLGPSVSLDHPVKPPVLTAPAARHLSERSLLGERRSDSRCLYKYCVLSLKPLLLPAACSHTTNTTSAWGEEAVCTGPKKAHSTWLRAWRPFSILGGRSSRWNMWFSELQHTPTPYNGALRSEIPTQA